LDWRSIVAVLFIVSAALLASPVLGPGQSAAQLAPETSTDVCLQHERHDAFRAESSPTVTLHRTDNNSVVRYQFDGTGSEPMFGFEIQPGVRIQDSSRFEIDETYAERKYNADTPRVEIALGSPHSNLTYATSKQTVVVPVFRSDDVDLFFKPNTTGYVGAHFALLGN